MSAAESVNCDIAWRLRTESDLRVLLGLEVVKDKADVLVSFLKHLQGCFILEVVEAVLAFVLEYMGRSYEKKDQMFADRSREHG